MIAESMTPMQRMQAAVKLEPVDRIPCAPLMDVFFPARYKGFSVAEAMRDCLSSPEKTAAMGRAARERVERIFQWRDAAANLVDVFEDTIRAAHSRSRAA